jgi:uncharacterized membrane protein
MVCGFSIATTQAQEVTPNTDAPIVVSHDEFLRGVITRTSAEAIEGNSEMLQHITVRLISGAEKGTEVTILHGGVFADPTLGVHKGDAVVLVKSVVDGETNYYLADRYRLPHIAILIIILIGITIAVARLRGIAALGGLAASALVIAYIMLPQIAGGINPILVAVCGGIAITVISTLLTHGINREAGLVIAAITIALLLGALGAYGATWLLSLGGIGSEEAVALTYGPLADMNLRGLLIAGIILGALGVLDDIAATQISTVKEISSANTQYTTKQLYRRGMRVGGHHVAALINTLFLAYTGAALPLLLVGMVNLNVPWWAFINTEAVSEELVRTIVGSIALILTVPIATGLASWYFGAVRGKHEEATEHHA